jgi:hypothetical protein
VDGIVSLPSSFLIGSYQRTSSGMQTSKASRSFFTPEPTITRELVAEWRTAEIEYIQMKRAAEAKAAKPSRDKVHQLAQHRSSDHTSAPLADGEKTIKRNPLRNCVVNHLPGDITISQHVRNLPDEEDIRPTERKGSREEPVVEIPANTKSRSLMLVGRRLNWVRGQKRWRL